MVGFDWLWSATTCKSADHVWLGLVSFCLLQSVKKGDWIWLGLIGFGLLQPAKKSDHVLLGLIGFGPLQPANLLIRYGLVHYNLQRKVIRYGWV